MGPGYLPERGLMGGPLGEWMRQRGSRRPLLEDCGRPGATWGGLRRPGATELKARSSGIDAAAAVESMPQRQRQRQRRG